MKRKELKELKIEFLNFNLSNVSVQNEIISNRTKIHKPLRI